MKKIETAVILCAGLGSRLTGLSGEKPKGFLEVDGKSLIQRSVEHLQKAGITKFIFGTGHLDHVYSDFAKKVSGICVKNENYAQTGSMYTLLNLKQQVKDDFLLLEADLLYDQNGLEEVLSCKSADAILASGKTNSEDEVFIEVDAQSNLVNLSKDPKTLGKVDCELVGISKVSYATYQAMCEIAEGLHSSNPKLDYEHVFVGVSKTKPLYVHQLDNYVWCEIDDAQAFDRAINQIYPNMVNKEL